MIFIGRSEEADERVLNEGAISAWQSADFSSRVENERRGSLSGSVALSDAADTAPLRVRIVTSPHKCRI